MRQAVFLLIPIVLALAPARIVAGPVRTAEINDIREYILREQFSSLGNAKKKENRPVWFFVEFGRGQDPDDAFLRRFSDLRHKIAPYSAARIDRIPGRFAYRTVVHRRTREKGMILSIREIRFLQPNDARVSAAFFRGGRDAGSATYEVSRRDGKWRLRSLRWSDGT
ncbi:MAG: hypothetical protein SFU56_03270 [Capsulimonadales bacterium]|nr:hypothetical protein [Capsulimonadales bacterium]